MPGDELQKPAPATPPAPTPPTVNPALTTTSAKDLLQRPELKELIDSLAAGDKTRFQKALDLARQKAVEIFLVSVMSLAVVLSGIFKDSVTDWWSHRNDNSAARLKQIAERDIQIRDMLTGLRIQLQADRVHVCIFESGANTEPIRRFSCHYETRREGVSAEVGALQQVPTSLIADMLKLLTGGQDPCFFKVEDLTAASWRAILKGRGTAYFAEATLQHPPGTLLGFVHVDWNGPMTTGALTPEDIKLKVREIADRVVFLLSQVETK